MFAGVRLPDWETRLGSYLQEPGRSVFDWGTNDCALCGVGAVMAMTGEHPAPQFVGAYDDREGAALALRELGAGTLVATMDDLFPRMKTGHARRGDLVFAQAAVGICLGATAVFLTETDGFTHFPRAAFEIAWRI